MSDFTKKTITKKSEDIAAWYNDIVLRAELADYSAVKGSMIIRPYGYAIWEYTKKTLDPWFKEDGVENAYFPLLIPYELIEKEKEHLEGFSPELAIVTHAGGKKLTSNYVVRPTSETIMYRTFAEWIHSYRDLPMKINQWCNVVRWEKRTYPFLRTSEFLWQEGHTVHTTELEAIGMALKALEWYKRFYEEYFAISVYAGIKSKRETFAGAKTTYAIEMVIPDGKALQAATSHNLSDNFANVFDISYLDEQGKKQHPFQTSWGLSTRSIGGLVLVHGDDNGLVMPPKVAPVQAVIVVIGAKEEAAQTKLQTYAMEIHKQLIAHGIRTKIDTDFSHSLGYRINEWEMRGVPVRIEIGSKEIDKDSITCVRRDNFEKSQTSSETISEHVSEILTTMQADLLTRSEKNKRELTVETTSYDEFKTVMGSRRSFIRVPWCEHETCEERVKKETKATSRVLELDHIDKIQNSTCIFCGKKATRKWLFAQAY